MPIVKKLRAFTLIELLVVISIIAILITVIVATFGTTQEKARDSNRKTDLDAFKKALELHKSDTPGASHYPGCDTGNDDCVLETADSFDPPLSVVYLKDFPLDPDRTSGYNYRVDDSADCSLYDSDGDGTTDTKGCSDYELFACLENVNDSDKDDVDGGAEDKCGTTGTEDELVSYTIFNP